MVEELLRPRDVAKIFGIIIRAVRLPTGKLRYPRIEVERLWRQLKRRKRDKSPS